MPKTIAKTVQDLDRSDALFEAVDAEKAAALYVEKGITPTTATEVGMPVELFAVWVRSPAGLRAIKLLQYRLNSVLETKLSRIIETATDRVLDALQNGNEVAMKDGTIVNVAVGAKEAAGVLAVAFDKRQLLRNLPTTISDVDAKMEELATRLKSIGSAVANRESKALPRTFDNEEST